MLTEWRKNKLAYANYMYYRKNMCFRQAIFDAKIKKFYKRDKIVLTT